MRISDWSSRVLFRSCTCRGAEPGEAVAGLRECRIDLDRRGDRAGAGEGERAMIVIRLGLRRGIGVEAVALMCAGPRPDRSAGRRGGTGWVSPGRPRGATAPSTKKTTR